MQRLEGKRAVVTGGAQGIGAAIARRLADEGAVVAVLDLAAEKAGTVLLHPHIGVACDVADSASVDAAFAEVAAKLGGVDVLVNNAGIGSAPGDGMAEFYAGQAARAGGDDSAFADQTIHCSDEGWSRVLAVTLDGAFRCSRAAVRIMSEQGTGGTIVNIGSTAALAGNGPVPYVTAKAAVLGMTRAMARELAPRGIRVNAVNPGATETPIYAPLPEEVKAAVAADSVMKRLARPEEVAGAVAYLASDDASYATGSTVNVNGGAWFS
ncbi:SDR family NAD(P)-dependent oxidoreductase [Novosphingobium taihuense]|uniref:3-oxoacyl-[acyl-carrier protein] reductase n=1 Tax=Novosphingobium taihuense TaxID=260085 RepID=A0A7W7ADH4_9SPHN|nr:SDR family oxidoreductase [Novosphingobium taihuense]MBB4614097.1 3-oxoacyl-[acyl-carrier protein] reductase [Novosphingobium taihuense]TWH86947.1 3-oxoacyl-[acyl-carrier protein] reductase [Novosphingobium taihuense]